MVWSLIAKRTRRLLLSPTLRQPHADVEQLNECQSLQINGGSKWRRLIFLMSLMLLWSSHGWAQTISLVQELPYGVQSAGGTNPSYTFSGAQTAGNANVIIFEYYPSNNSGPGPATSVTDSKGNTYKRICGPITTISSGNWTDGCGGGSPTRDNAVTTYEMWLANSIASATPGSNTVTAHLTNNSLLGGYNIWLIEVHIATAGYVLALDQFVSQQTTYGTPAPTGTTGTTTSPNELFIAWCTVATDVCQPTPAFPWIDIPLNGENYYDTHSDAAYQIVTSEQTASATFAEGRASDERLAGIVTLKPQLSNSLSNPPPTPPTGLTAAVN
jgi:hypothetical protein